MHFLTLSVVGLGLWALSLWDAWLADMFAERGCPLLSRGHWVTAWVLWALSAALWLVVVVELAAR